MPAKLAYLHAVTTHPDVIHAHPDAVHAHPDAANAHLDAVHAHLDAGEALQGARAAAEEAALVAVAGLGRREAGRVGGVPVARGPGERRSPRGQLHHPAGERREQLSGTAAARTGRD